MSLHDYGWCAFFSTSLEALDDPELEPGRVIRAGAGAYRLTTARGDQPASLAGRLRHAAASAADLPAVGDWVAFRRADATAARIDHVLARRTRLSRKVPGRRSEEQMLAANIDTVLVVMGMDADFSVRRAERFLAIIRESGARPVLVLNKLDLCHDHGARLSALQPATAGVTTLSISCTEGIGLEAVWRQIRPRETAVLVGSSGVGKSTLMNLLLGASLQKTRAVRLDDGRGRHTTAHRELFRLPGGGLLIDNPGIREVQLWVRDDNLAGTFEDVADLATRCRYRDCSHEREPGCAVIAGIEAGAIDSSRLQSYRSLLKEIRYLETRLDESAQRAQKRVWRIVHKAMRRSHKKGWR